MNIRTMCGGSPALLVLLVAAGCALVDTRPARVSVQTDRSTYSAGAEMWISIQNNRGKPVLRHFVCTPGVSPMKQWLDGVWQEYLPPDGCRLGYTPPDTIASGDVYHRKQPGPVHAGIYRYEYHLTTLDGTLLPQGERTSNAFTVTDG